MRDDEQRGSDLLDQIQFAKTLLAHYMVKWRFVNDKIIWLLDFGSRLPVQGLFFSCQSLTLLWEVFACVFLWFN